MGTRVEGRRDVVVVGGGPAGMAAAARAAELGLDVLMVDEGERLGGILPQCIHPGFGVHYLGEELTGPEFAQRLASRVEDAGVDVLLEAHVPEVRWISHAEKGVRVLSPGFSGEVRTGAVIYAAGARERHRFEIGIHGDRVAGVYTAGEAQTMMDVYGILPGRRVLVVGSGDVGMIVARRFALEGAEVVGVVEIMPYPGGLTRNVVQCLEDFDIPLLLSHRVVAVKGRGRVEKAVLVRVDEGLRDIPGTETEVECDTVVVSAGLVPRVEVLRELGALIDPATGGPMVNDRLETTVPGVFAAGNALVINDLVDHAAEQGEQAAEGAAEFLRRGGIPATDWVKLRPGEGVKLTVPQLLSGERDVWIYLRVTRPVRNARLSLRGAGREVRLPVVRPAEMVRVKLMAGEVRRAKVGGREVVAEVYRG